MTRADWRPLAHLFPTGFVRARTHRRYDPATERTVWSVIEAEVGRRVGFGVEMYWAAGWWSGVGDPDSFQLMPTVRAERERGVFWDWHLDHNRQFFAHPLDAACAFVSAWERWLAERR